MDRLRMHQRQQSYVNVHKMTRVAKTTSRGTCSTDSPSLYPPLPLRSAARLASAASFHPPELIIVRRENWRGHYLYGAAISAQGSLPLFRRPDHLKRVAHVRLISVFYRHHGRLNLMDCAKGLYCLY